MAVVAPAPACRVLAALLLDFFVVVVVVALVSDGFLAAGSSVFDCGVTRYSLPSNVEFGASSPLSASDFSSLSVALRVVIVGLL